MTRTQKLQALILILFLTVGLLIGLRLTRMFPGIATRTVQIHLNALKFKYDDAGRALLTRDFSEYDLGGGFPWQNRLLVPLVLQGANLIVQSQDPTLRALRIVYAGIVVVAVSLAFVSVYAYSRWFFTRSGTLGLDVDADRLAALTTLLGAILMGIALLGEPSWVVASDYIEVGFFGVAMLLILARADLLSGNGFVNAASASRLSRSSQGDPHALWINNFRVMTSCQATERQCFVGDCS